MSCDGNMATWRANTGTKWPSSASMAKAQSRVAAAVKVMMQGKPFALYFCARWSNFRAVLPCPRPLTRRLNSDWEIRLVKKIQIHC